MIVKFPDRAFRGCEASRRPRRSKNGTPEERAGSTPTQTRPRKPRRSKNGTPEERAAKRAAASAMILRFDPKKFTSCEPAVRADLTDDSAKSKAY
jgi:hypothetical protein